MQGYYVYAIKSQKDNRIYVGISKNPKMRLNEHNDGDTKSTNSRRPFIILYYEAHTSEEDARRREKYFKTDKGKSSLKQMIINGLMVN